MHDGTYCWLKLGDWYMSLSDSFRKESASWFVVRAGNLRLSNCLLGEAAVFTLDIVFDDRLEPISFLERCG